MNPIHNPFTRDEHPDLTAAILGVVNGQPRPVEEDLQTPERAAEMGARKKKAAQHSADAMKRNPEGAGTAAIVNSEIDLHIKDKRERDSKKTYGTGGKVVREDIQTPERAEQQRKRIKSAERGAIFGSRYGRADRTGRLRQLQRIDAREKADTKTTWGVSEPHHIRGHDESTPRRSRKRKVQEAAKLDERLVGGADFLQASKNLLTGKGFKTNREVSGARVNANMAAMQRRKARAAKKKN